MRLSPTPWEGLHPAFPQARPPLTCCPQLSAVSQAGQIGIYGVALGALIRGRPEIGLVAAAWSSVLFGLASTYKESSVGQIAKTFLASKNIEVPRRKVFERLGHFDQDNFLLLGGLAGICVAAVRRHALSVGLFSRYAGAATFGTYGASVVMRFAPWPAANLARQQSAIDQLQSKQYQEEIAKTYNKSDASRGRLFQSQVAFGPDIQDESKQKRMEGRSPQQAVHEDAMEKLRRYDEEDPRPHYTMLEGEELKRQFEPAPNYDWRPQGRAARRRELDEHLAYLRNRRSEISAEAEYLWRRIAANEAEYKMNDYDEQDEIRSRKKVALGLLNGVHVELWREINNTDWMIADTTKRILQAEAEQNNTSWIPPKPALSQNLRFEQLLRLSRENLDLTEETLEMADVANKDVEGKLLAHFMTTGEDVGEARKKLEEGRKELVWRREVFSDLLRDLENEERQEVGNQGEPRS